MEGQFYVVNSERTLENFLEHVRAEFKEHKYLKGKVYAGKRTLDQNALKSVWYNDIAKHRGDVTAKDVERECKYKYGLNILRRDPMHDYVFSKSVDILPYEKRHVVMDCFAVTSIMTVEQKKEYLTMMQNDYPFLSNERGK